MFYSFFGNEFFELTVQVCTKEDVYVQRLLRLRRKTRFARLSPPADSHAFGAQYSRFELVAYFLQAVLNQAFDKDYTDVDQHLHCMLHLWMQCLTHYAIGALLWLRGVRVPLFSWFPCFYNFLVPKFQLFLLFSAYFGIFTHFHTVFFLFVFVLFCFFVCGLSHLWWLVHTCIYAPIVV